MPSLVRRQLVVTWLALLGGLGHGCIAPTLPPLPPPQAKASAPVDGQVEVTGEVLPDHAGAMVLSLNNYTGEIGGQLLDRDEVRFAFKMRAEPGEDVLTVFYLLHEDQSEAVLVDVPAPSDGEPAVDAGSGAAP
jgi:hypothetical protein